MATEYGRAEYDVPVKEKLERMATAYGLHTGWGSPWPENEVPAPQVSKTHGGQRAYAPLSPVFFFSNHALRWHAPPRQPPPPASLQPARRRRQVARPYPEQLQEHLGPRFRVRNFGIGGVTMLHHGHNPYSHPRRPQVPAPARSSFCALVGGLELKLGGRSDAATPCGGWL